MRDFWKRDTDLIEYTFRMLEEHLSENFQTSYHNSCETSCLHECRRGGLPVHGLLYNSFITVQGPLYEDKMRNFMNNIKYHEKEVVSICREGRKL